MPHYIRISIALLLSLLSSAASAQGFTVPWICADRADSTSQVWFRRTYTGLGDVARAVVQLTTTGFAQLYVNGRNVSADPMTPYRTGGGHEPLTLRYDVTAYVRPDTTVLAVWYSPTSPHADSCQVAVGLELTSADGICTAMHSGADWLWRTSSYRLNGRHGEYADGRVEVLPWSYGAVEWPLWRGAQAVDAPRRGLSALAAMPLRRCRVAEVVRPLSLVSHADTLTAIFPRELTALPRLTLRGAARGMRVYMPGFCYVCSGDIDEQAYPKFCVSRFSQLCITGDAAFRPDMVQDVEAVVVTPYDDSPEWLYDD